MILSWFCLHFFTTNYNWMCTSKNVGLKPSFDIKRAFIVTHAFKILITRFQWFYSLIIDFKLNFFTFLVETDYNWMFTSGNVKLKPSINRKNAFIVVHAFKNLITRFKWFYNLIIDFKLNFLHFLLKQNMIECLPRETLS